MQEREKLDQSLSRRPTPPLTPPLLFYKLIVSSILQAKKLRIPRKFVKRCGDQLSAVTTLTLPTGGVWPVGLKKAGKKLWFFHGWHEFVEYHSIHVGYFLIFRYEGNSNFNVNIFDLTTSEINYPSYNLTSSKKTCDGKQCPVSGGKEMNDDDHDDGETSSSAPRVSFRNEVYDECVDQQLLGEDHCKNLHLAKDGDDLQAPFLSTRDIGSQFIQFDSPRDIGSQFIQFDSPRDIGIQFDSCDLTDSECEVEWLCLDASNGKAYRTEAKRKRDEPDANESWAQHEDEVNLPGLTTSKQRWRVTVEKSKRAIHAAKMFQPSYPFCRVIMQRSYVHERALLHMPSNFAEKFLRGVSRFITLQVSDGKQWSVRCISYEGKVKLSRGWSEFVGDNKLEEGDVCVFEIINMEDVVLKVSIFRVLEDSKMENQSSN